MRLAKLRRSNRCGKQHFPFIGFCSQSQVHALCVWYKYQGCNSRKLRGRKTHSADCLTPNIKVGPGVEEAAMDHQLLQTRSASKQKNQRLQSAPRHLHQTSLNEAEAGSPSKI